MKNSINNLPIYLSLSMGLTLCLFTSSVFQNQVLAQSSLGGGTSLERFERVNEAVREQIRNQVQEEIQQKKEEQQKQEVPIEETTQEPEELETTPEQIKTPPVVETKSE